MSRFKRKGDHYLGGNQSWTDPTSVYWKDKVCNDPSFQSLCEEIYYSVIPSKGRLAQLFELCGFNAVCVRGF